MRNIWRRSSRKGFSEHDFDICANLTGKCRLGKVRLGKMEKFPMCRWGHPFPSLFRVVCIAVLMSVAHEKSNTTCILPTPGNVAYMIGIKYFLQRY